MDTKNNKMSITEQNLQGTTKLNSSTMDSMYNAFGSFEIYVSDFVSWRPNSCR